jgi:hypothetical protein
MYAPILGRNQSQVVKTTAENRQEKAIKHESNLVNHNKTTNEFASRDVSHQEQL